MHDDIREVLKKAYQIEVDGYTFYSMAAAQGSLAGKHYLARLYRDGKGTPKDPIRAYVLLSQAKGYAPADKDLMQLVGAMKETQLKKAQAKLAEVEKSAESVNQ